MMQLIILGIDIKKLKKIILINFINSFIPLKI